jgi:hypothetical protein
MANVTTTTRTPYAIASSALVMLGANPVASFAATGTAETIACFYTWQPVVDHYLSLYPWRFASKLALLARLTAHIDAEKPEGRPGLYPLAYALPSDLKKINKVIVNDHPIQYDRERMSIMCDGAKDQRVFCEYIYEPPIAFWPGYFVSLIEAAMMHRLSFALSAKLDLKKDVRTDIEKLFLLARSADSQQQTSRKLRLTGRGSIMEARRA